MPITLVTGTPGAGKTLFAVKKIVEEIIPTGRPIYVNINGFSHPSPNVHVVGEEGPREWLSYPDGAFCIFDEVQRQYPFKNSMSKNPDYITGYETHRHRGMDFIFITQGPYLIDRHLHPLIDHHFHIYRPFGLKRSTVLEWQGVNEKPAPLQSRANAVVRNFNFPKKYFSHYKSATIHTVKMTIPWKLVGFFLLLALGIGVIAWKALDLRSARIFAGGGLADAAAAEDAGGAASGSSARSCVVVLAATPSYLLVKIEGNRIRLDPASVKLTQGQLFVGDDSALSWPVCRVTR